MLIDDYRESQEGYERVTEGWLKKDKPAFDLFLELVLLDKQLLLNRFDRERENDKIIQKALRG